MYYVTSGDSSDHKSLVLLFWEARAEKFGNPCLRLYECTSGSHDLNTNIIKVCIQESDKLKAELINEWKNNKCRCLVHFMLLVLSV